MRGTAGKAACEQPLKSLAKFYRRSDNPKFLTPSSSTFRLGRQRITGAVADLCRSNEALVLAQKTFVNERELFFVEEKYSALFASTTAHTNTLASVTNFARSF